MTLCTENEAREKWCPFARTQILQTDITGQSYSAAVNRTFRLAPDGNLSELVAGTQCIGSRCMAWRFGHEMTTEQIAILGSADTLTRVGTKLSEKGYCGAFGKVDQ